ncbi:hypothetical protein SLA_2931 [Streptomyces laurentii]|uniref:Uncharacterized protein n=1 Tax=Streptomyces laurentii TaxID=39478 RepID=A0A160NY93_STRLU|nr:hypothetical protein SLA_2931 [Streptomyces laurentii]
MKSIAALQAVVTAFPSDAEPSDAELKTIELETPRIEADVKLLDLYLGDAELLDLYIGTLNGPATDLAERRLRRACRRVLAERRALTNRVAGQPPVGGAA